MVSKRQRRRRVSFSEKPPKVCMLTNVAPASVMTMEERESVWYNTDDMQSMRDDAKLLARQLRFREMHPQQQQQQRSTTPPLTSDSDSDSPYYISTTPQEQQQQSLPTILDVRGLEIRIYLQRQIRRYIASQKIMEYQRTIKAKIAMAQQNGYYDTKKLLDKGNRKLGSFSAKCSQWARDLALVTGRVDFEGVYKNHHSEELFQSDLHSRKRKLSSSSSNSANEEVKRQRYDNCHGGVENFYLSIQRHAC